MSIFMVIYGFNFLTNVFLAKWLVIFFVESAKRKFSFIFFNQVILCWPIGLVLYQTVDGWLTMVLKEDQILVIGLGAWKYRNKTLKLNIDQTLFQTFLVSLNDVFREDQIVEFWLCLLHMSDMFFPVHLFWKLGLQLMCSVLVSLKYCVICYQILFMRAEGVFKQCLLCCHKISSLCWFILPALLGCFLIPIVASVWLFPPRQHGYWQISLIQLRNTCSIFLSGTNLHIGQRI